MASRFGESVFLSRYLSGFGLAALIVLLLHLLAPRRAAYFLPPELAVLDPPPDTEPAAEEYSDDAARAASMGEDGTRAPVPHLSKKESSTRNRELLDYIAEPLNAMCTAAAPTLLRSSVGSAILVEVTL